MPTTTTEPTVWARVRAEIERRGWRQYRGPAGLDEVFNLTDEEWRTGPCCLLQAVGAVLGDDNAAVGQANERIAKRIGTFNIGQWNDRPERFVHDVYALLDELDAEDRAA